MGIGYWVFSRVISFMIGRYCCWFVSSGFMEDFFVKREIFYLLVAMFGLVIWFSFLRIYNRDIGIVGEVVSLSCVILGLSSFVLGFFIKL